MVTWGEAAVTDHGSPDSLQRDANRLPERRT